MITLSSAKKRADEFAAAVDAPATGSASPARPELAELVDLAAALRAHPTADVAPRPDFSTTLRDRLMAEASATWTYDPSATRLTLPARPSGRRERRLAAAATALVLAGGSAGMAAAAQQALPGEALYPIKRGIEDVRAGLSGDEAAKGRTLLDQATHRLTEARTLVDRSEADTAVGATIDTYRTQALTGSSLLIDSYEDTGDEAAVEDVRAFTQDGLARLAELSELVPADLQGPIQDAALTLQQIELSAAEACPTCGGDDEVAPVAGAFGPAMDAARAMAAIEGEPVSNDHPLISAPRDSSTDKQSDRPRGGQGPGTDDGPAGDVAGGGVDGLDEDLADGLNDGLDDGLGDVEAAGPGVAGPLRQAEDAVGKGADRVRKGVKDAGRTADRVRKTVEDTTDPLLDPDLP